MVEPDTRRVREGRGEEGKWDSDCFSHLRSMMTDFYGDV